MKKQKKKTIKKFVREDNICNICLHQQTKLSSDHVPPKACPPAKNRTIDKLLYQIVGNRSFRPRISQSGVRYRTICADCNNRLGFNYDLALGQFSHAVENFVSGSIILPNSFQVECRPNAIIRSVLGHLLAAKTKHDDVVIDTLIRPSILDKTVPVHDDIHLFYWVYPYEKTIIFRDFVMPSIRGTFDRVSCFSMIKFYPVSFLVAYQLPEYENLRSLHKFNSVSAEDEALVTIDLRPIKSSMWPEKCPGMDNFLMYGRTADDSVYSVPRARKIKI